MKKVIGVYADTFNGKVGQTFAYMQFLSQFGYVRMISTTDRLDNIVNEIDMLVVPGGADVYVDNYNAVPGVMDTRVNQHYEYLDKVLIPQFVDAGKPIVGICRGLQRLNVFFGGTLHQHIVGHQQGEDRTRTKQTLRLVHSDVILHVNSMHHQAIDVLGEGFEVLGYSNAYQGCYAPYNNVEPWKTFNDKGVYVKTERVPVIIEIIKHATLPILAFQYHPEEFNCEYAVSEINNLLK
jgi:putative glutamine amidotransferase